MAGMSDVPELDRLIAEHETFRRNMAWMRRDMHSYFGFRLMIAAVVITPLAMCFGLAGAATSPLVWRLTEYAVPRPVWRDPFQRYMVK
jgi:hypothetical protein